MNLATKAPNFTPANASEMGRRGALARIANEKARAAKAEADAKALRDIPASADEQARLKVVLRQLQIVDNEIEEVADSELRCKLIAAKARLWSLAFPTAGVIRPRSQSARRSTSSLPDPEKPAS